MGQLEKAARRLHDAIVSSDLFGRGTAAQVAMSYAPVTETLPYAVYDFSGADWLNETEDPIEQIVSIEATIQVFSRSGFTCLRLSDKRLAHLASQNMLRMATGFRTQSDDYTPEGPASRGIVRGVIECALEL